MKVLYSESNETKNPEKKKAKVEVRFAERK